MDENNFNSNEIEGMTNNSENTSNAGQQYNIVPTPSDGTSTAVLVLGIVTLAMSVFCCGGGIVSVVCGIIGLVLGIPQMKKNPNDTKAKIGVILSAVGLAIYLLVIGISIILSVTGLLSEVLYGLTWI